MIVFAATVLFQLSASLPGRGPADVRALVDRARAARLQQDSLLDRYEVVVRQRMSLGVGLTVGRVPLGPIGRDRLAGRIESVANVGWSQALGAWGEVIAARSVLPIAGLVTPNPEGDDFAIILPYYPGRDRLWPTTEIRNALPSHDTWIEHPLSPGADSVYEFSIGDSISIRLPDQQRIHLREIRVRPRRPDGRLIVGSLWVDVATGSLARAAYRPSAPVDLWPIMEREIGRNDRDKVKKFGPFTGIIREIIVDHGLYQGRFWLPRTRVATAEGTASGGRVTLSMEQTFQYGRVDALAPGAHPVFLPDTVSDVDSTGRVRSPVWRRVEGRGSRCRAKGDTIAARWSADSLARDARLTTITAEGIRVRVLMPCDRGELVTSPKLPRSIYSSGDELFPNTDFGALRREVEGSLGMSDQAEWNPQPPKLFYGIDRKMLRYNRIEGLSAGIMGERTLGKGYLGGALARIGVADREPLGEVFMRRGNVATEVQASAYRRLAAVNDWGDPLGVGASIAAAVFGRDDGFYFRTAGAEVTGTQRSANDRLLLSWRLFGERQTTAEVETHRSLANAVNGTRFAPNIVANRGDYWGAATTAAYFWGLDPRGTRISGNTRLESAAGGASYGRAMTELTIARGLLESAQLSLTGAAGASVGTLPQQRWWFLGGPYTVHAQTPGEAAGDAFWLGRCELAMGQPLVRPIVFADIGWAGPRGEWSRSTEPMSAVGLGASMMDGLVRLDVARGLRPRGGWRVDLYFEVR